ncbi:ASCH domain-containing protein [Streptomyces durbertensis]|uniref:ASCH domain-containing protein n=1 Tax=Streptomyces durbertensis TaxID=2448886 RepID=A0ABR6ECJ4_9ACTN|nr:ASCH domain-containing protein [Streptomyces durbertensis]MBB1243050.1 ASCH domain-containing protein [Streptomyces durbertensis]
MTDYQSLPRAEFGFPGPLRDRLVAAVLSGAKTTTTSLAAGYRVAGEALPRPGDRSVLVDSADRPLAVLETVEVRVLPLGEVELRHAVDEGEGHTTLAAWRADHEEFWHSAEFRASLGDPEFTVDDRTEVVTERLRVLRRL